MTTARQRSIGAPSALIVMLAAGLAGAADYTWTGGGDGTTWASAANWGGGGYPAGAGDTATIDAGAAAIGVASDLTIGALTLSGDYTGTITLGGTLTVTHADGASGDLTVNAGTLRTHTSTAAPYSGNITVAGTFTIGAHGTVVVRRSSTAGDGLGQIITAGHLTVEGVLHADGQGFGPGGGPGAPNYGSGASHGGVGGHGAGALKATYGSFDNPVSLGSGAHASLSGGGAIVIVSTGTVTVNGDLRANAQHSTSTQTAPAGGSINITAETLAGTGVIAANGGNNSAAGRGAGGGGRISLNGVTTDTFTGTLRANGGLGSSGVYGFAGTIYLNSARRANLTLGGVGNLASLRLGSDGNNDYTFGTITIQAGGTLQIQGNPLMHSGRGSAATIHVTDLHVQDGGTLSATGMGFNQGKGPSPGGYKLGATHAGRGGDDNSEGSGQTYGSATNPITMGSGGSGSSGGGAIIIVASSVNVAGTISANGVSGGGYGRGAGGSINIVAVSMDGEGTVAANGGDGTSNVNNPSGGGGRIAVVTSGTGFGSLGFTAFGGANPTASARRGAAGTVYLRHAGHTPGGGVLTVSNPYTTLTLDVTDLPAVLFPGDDDLRSVAMAIKDHGRINLTADLTLGGLDLTDALTLPCLYLHGHTLTVRALKPAGWDAIEAVKVVKDGGEIVWSRPGTLMTMR